MITSNRKGKSSNEMFSKLQLFKKNVNLGTGKRKTPKNNIELANCNITRDKNNECPSNPTTARLF